MKDQLRLLVALQDVDSRIREKRAFIEKVPLRIFEVDDPLKRAQAELEKMKQKNEALAKKKREKEKQLQDVQEKVGKMKSRVSDIKTNKEYQAHLKEIETAEAEIGGVEEEILEAMEELDASSALVRDVEAKVNVELGKLEAFKRELDEEVRQHETEVASLQEQRRQLVASVDPDANALYERLLRLGKGVAVTGAKNEICLGCDMHMPPQLFVEIRKNDDIIQCPQCRRILYYSEDAAEG